MPEYDLLIEAVELREADRDYRSHLQAFLNFSVQAKRRAGKNREVPVYRTFRKFYDYEREIRRIRDKGKGKGKSRLNAAGKLLKKGGRA